MRRISTIIRTLFALCLLVATFNHAWFIFLHGPFWDYGFGSKTAWSSKVYWDVLTVVDPLAAILLFAKPRAGLWLTIAIIVSDVLHNTYYIAISGHWLDRFYLAQVGFLVAVLGLAPVVASGFAPRKDKLTYIHVSIP
jgi:hypothetical protein